MTRDVETLKNLMHEICSLLAIMEHLDKIGELSEEEQNSYLLKIDELSKQEVIILHEINDMKKFKELYKELNDETFLKRFDEAYQHSKYMAIIQRKRIAELNNRLLDKKTFDDVTLYKEIIKEDLSDNILKETNYVMNNLEPYSNQRHDLIKSKYDILIDKSLNNLTTNQEILNRKIKRDNKGIYSIKNISFQKLHIKCNMLAKYCSMLGSDPEISWYKEGNEEIIANNIAKTLKDEEFEIALYKENEITSQLLSREFYKNAVIRYSKRALDKLNKLQYKDYSYYEYDVTSMENSKQL